MSIVKKYYKKKYAFQYTRLTSNIKDSVVFLTKGAATDITIPQLDELISKKNVVLIDPVDNPLDLSKARIASAVVAASLEAFDSYKSLGFNTILVNHHVDTRLKRHAFNNDRKLKIGYFGESVNTIMTDLITNEVDFVHVDTSTQNSSWLDKPAKYSAHYAIRSNNVEAFKPFLKGFTAAACGAVIIIQDDQKEAVRWLGSDYPYLMHGEPTEKNILQILTRVKETFHNTEWATAQRKMKDISLKTSDESIAKDFIQGIESL